MVDIEPRPPMRPVFVAEWGWLSTHASSNPDRDQRMLTR